jgi:hypothetical protein
MDIRADSQTLRTEVDTASHPSTFSVILDTERSIYHDQRVLQEEKMFPSFLLAFHLVHQVFDRGTYKSCERCKPMWVLPLDLVNKSVHNESRDTYSF